MARVTIEDCLEKINNRFSLVHLTAKRVRRHLHEGISSKFDNKNKEIVVALREIAAGIVYPVAVKENKIDPSVEEEDILVVN